MPARSPAGQRYWFKGRPHPGIRRKATGDQSIWFNGYAFQPIVPLSHSCTLEFSVGLGCVGSVDVLTGLDIPFSLVAEATINQVVLLNPFNLTCVPVVTSGCQLNMEFQLFCAPEVVQATASLPIEFNLVVRGKIEATKESCLTGDGSLPEPETIAGSGGKKNLCL